MRAVSWFAAAAIIAAIASAPVTPALAQEKKEGVVEKVERSVKRTWKNIVGYKFVASCPALLPVNKYNCAETGKNKEEARAKCAAKHRFCLIQDAG